MPSAGHLRAWVQKADVYADVLLVLRQGPRCLQTPLLEMAVVLKTCTNSMVSDGRSDPQEM